MALDRLLVVDDNQDNLFILSQLIEQHLPEVQLLTTRDPNRAWAMAQSEPLVGALIDVQMPTMDGIELCRRFKSDPDTRTIPIILITAHHSSAERKAQGLEAGADDFITRPIDNVELVARIRVMLRMHHTEMALQDELDLSCARIDLSSASLQGAALETMAHQMLMACQRLTRSRHGYVAGYDPETSRGWIEAGTGLSKMLNEYLLEEDRFHALFAQEQPGFFSEGQTNPLLALLPDVEGADRFLTVPLKIEERIVGQVALAGALTPYSERDLDGVRQMAAIYTQTLYRARQEEKNAQLTAQLLEAQKMEALGTLAGGVAHDFNNMLVGVSGYTELVLSELPEDSEHAGYLQEVLQGVERAKGLVNQILAFSRPGKVAKEVLCINGLLDEVLSLLRPSFPASIAIKKVVPTENLFVRGAPSQLHQVLLNLGTNALQAMESRGDVLEIRLETLLSGSQPNSPAPFSPSTNYLRLSMTDNGCGMTDEVRQRLFDPYFTTKGIGKGSGLGLSVALGIVKDHNGHIQFRSELGQGSTFDVYLPLVESPEQKKTVESPASTPGHEHILLVDDEETLVKLWQVTLQRLGYRVSAFSSSREAMETIQQDVDAVDLLLTDQTMPGFSGLDLATEASRLKPGLPVVIMTGYSKQLTEENVKKAGVCDVVYKPLTGKRMAQVLRSALDTAKPSENHHSC